MYSCGATDLLGLKPLQVSALLGVLSVAYLYFSMCLDDPCNSLTLCALWGQIKQIACLISITNQNFQIKEHSNQWTFANGLIYILLLRLGWTHRQEDKMCVVSPWRPRDISNIYSAWHMPTTNFIIFAYRCVPFLCVCMQWMWARDYGVRIKIDNESLQTCPTSVVIQQSHCCLECR